MMRKSHTERRKTMENMGNKKLALLYILKILEEYSDRDHPMTQSDIAEKLEQNYGIILERKAVSRNLSLLREAGYEIESEAKGNYLDYRDFDNTELRLMIDGVLSSRYITESQAKNLADRIANLSNKHFRSHVKHIYLLSNHEKSENKTVFYALECIDEAIEKGRQISFDYYCYAFDDDLKPSRSRRETVSPIQLVIKNQFYYLIAATEVNVLGRAKEKDPTHPMIKSYRLDMISNPIIEEDAIVDTERLAKYGQERDIKKILSSHPYMHVKGTHISQASFLCFAQDINLVVENLGRDLKIKKLKRKDEELFREFETTTGKRYLSMNLVKVTLKISLNDLIEFACRYPQKIFIVSPNVAAERQKQLYKSHLDILDEILEYDE